ncbi:MAG: response regulator, partial [Bryobacteraceae bacterium]
MDKALHILLIEDNPGDAGLVREALREHNIPFEMALASDGAEAESYLSRMGKTAEAPCPDLILLDLNLPKVGGHEVLASFR